MAYSTISMVRLALIRTTDGSEPPSSPSGTAADLSNEQIADHIAEADALINGYLAGRYTTPVAAVGDPAVIPEPVNYWSRNIAAYEATCTYRGSMDFTDNDPVARRYKATMDALKDVAKGVLVLDLPGADGSGESPGSGGAGPAFNPYVGDLWVPADFISGEAIDDGTYQIPFWRHP